MANFLFKGKIENIEASNLQKSNRNIFHFLKLIGNIAKMPMFNVLALLTTLEF